MVDILRCNICEIDIYVNDMNDKVELGDGKVPVEVAAHVKSSRTNHSPFLAVLKNSLELLTSSPDTSGPSVLSIWQEMTE